MSLDSPVLYAALVSVGVILLVWAVAGRRKEAPTRLSGSRADLRQIQLQEGVGARAVTPSIRWFSLRARRLTPIGLIEAMDRRTKLAGLQNRWPLERALAAKFFVFLIGILIGFTFWVVPDPGWPLTGLAVAVLSYFVVDLILYSRADERQKAIERELPDTMDQLTISVESGMGFEGALDKAAEHKGPLAEELGRVLAEIQLGSSRRDALNNLVARTDVPDLRRFVAAMVHAEGFGVPIAQVLRTQAADLRDKRRQRAREKAQRIPIYMLFPLVFFIFPSIFVVLIGPAFIRIMADLFNQPLP